LTNQRAELHAAGCTRIFAEKITGTHAKRPELGRMLDHLRAGDVVTVTRLDRLARSTRDLLDIAEQLQAKGAGLRSLAEPWADTTTPAGRMVLTVFAGIAEFERSLIIDRTRNGREAAKARGVQFGRRPTLTPARSIMPASCWALAARRLKRPSCWACIGQPLPGAARPGNQPGRGPPARRVC
jgi:DNA invertase Pin-like site-specific DNA recombinase